MMRPIAVVWMTLLWAIAPAQRPAWEARLDTHQIQIGQQVNLLLEARLPRGTQARWPVVPDSGRGWLLVQRGERDTLEATDAGMALRQRLRITSFDSGRVYLPAWPLVLSDDTLRTDSLALQVTLPNLAARPDIYGLKDLLDVPRPWWFWALWIGIPLLVIVLAIGLWRLWRRRQAKETAPEVPRLPPYEEAIAALDALEREELWQKGAIKTYYSRLIDVLRRYWERRYGVRAMEKTAAELSADIPRLKLPREQAEELEQVLHQSAMVKYARQEPSSGANERAAQLVREVIETTRPAPENETEKEA